MRGIVDTLHDEEFSNYICAECDTIYEVFHLKCPSCGKPGTVQKIEITPKLYDDEFSLLNDAEMEFIDPVSASNITPAAIQNEKTPAIYKTGFELFDDMFDGGIYSGSVNIFLGRPGNGKTVFLLKIAELYSRSGLSVLFISSEESFAQLSGKIRKLGITSPKLFFVSMMELGASMREIDRFKPDIVVVDSVSGFFKKEIDAIQSSHIQIQECLAALSREAKNRDIAMLVSAQNLYPSCIHEYESLSCLADALFTLDKVHSNIMILKAKKTRFSDSLPALAFHCDFSSISPVDVEQLGISCEGLPETGEVSSIGTVSFSHIQGGALFFDELEALVGPGVSAAPKWNVGKGICRDSFETVAAVIEKYCKIKLSEMNINLRLKSETAVADQSFDLAIASALLSSFHDIEITKSIIFAGKIMLSGNVSAPADIEKRIKTAAGRGYKFFAVPDVDGEISRKYSENIDIININNIKCIRRSLSDKVLKRP